jgi:hypothetical protein
LPTIGFFDIGPVEHSNFLDAGDGIAAELRPREIAQDEHGVARLGGHDALHLARDSRHRLRAAVAQVDEQDLISLMAYKANALGNCR